VLGAATDLCHHAVSRQILSHLLAHPFDVGLAGHTALGQQARDAFVLVGLEEAEGQVLHLPLDLPDAQAVGQRREHRGMEKIGK